MPATLHAISYKATSSVLAVCSFEKPSLFDAAAWTKLRDDLVGGKLPIGLVKDRAIAVPASALVVDAITDVAPADAITNPYGFRVSAPPTAPSAVAGDGKDKVLAACGNAVSGPFVVKQSTAVVTVTLLLPASSTTLPVYLLFDNLDPIPGTIGTLATKLVTFQLPAGAAPVVGTYNDLVFLMEGVAVAYQAVNPTP